MNLYEFCESTYRQGDRERLNGIRATPENIKFMIGAFYNVFHGFFEDGPAFPAYGDLLERPVMNNGKFDRDNFSDHFALVFDVVTDAIRIPTFWSRPYDVSAEISHAVKVLYYGQMAEVSRDPNNGSIKKMGHSYENAKAILEADMEPPFKELY
ncbi:hypothetical protein STW0522CIT19_35790 [Citrobacter freundii]|nr:hypothetical protein STW0522CIT01_35820 [Citrobacter freundii]BBV37104.1 hypothetical protein STW0522CIT19_35790 [Citrobacter freundii]